MNSVLQKTFYLRHLLQKGGGIKPALMKCWQLYLREGLGGVGGKLASVHQQSIDYVESIRRYGTLTDNTRDFIQHLRMTGALLQSPPAFGSRIFYCRNGFRHWVRDVAWLEGCGFRWPEDVITVPPVVLSAFRPSNSVAHFWPEDFDADSIRSSMDMREFAASRLTGKGLEIGAGASPFPVPLNCNVIYGDRLSYDDLLKEEYPGQEATDFVVPDLCTDLDTLTGVEDESLDFIIACHVIEHVRNPIGAIENSWRKLRHDGNLVLVIPDMERTFDRSRERTSLEHLIDDYRSPDVNRDLPHYEEFYKLAFPTPEHKYAEVVQKKFAEQYSIHFHTWTYSSFDQLVKYVCENIAPWSKVWSHDTLKDKNSDIEFYFVLTK